MPHRARGDARRRRERISARRDTRLHARRQRDTEPRGMKRRRALLLAGGLAVIVALAVAIAGTARSGRSRPKACLPYTVSKKQAAKVGRAATRPTTLPDFSHLVVIMMENRECGQVVGSREAPFLNSLRRRYATLPDLYATTHPSFPNYVA